MAVFERADAFFDVLDLAQPPSHRLGFRELGLSIGLHGIDLIPGARRRFAALSARRFGRSIAS